MSTHPIIFTLAALSLAAMSVAHAGSSARIVEIHPSAEATLGRNVSFHVRIEYAADEPISLWARPYRDGNVVVEAMSNASSKYTGSGEALGWFALTEPGDVDEVRIIAGGGKPSIARKRTGARANRSRPEKWRSSAGSCY